MRFFPGPRHIRVLLLTVGMFGVASGAMAQTAPPPQDPQQAPPPGYQAPPPGYQQQPPPDYQQPPPGYQQQQPPPAYQPPSAYAPPPGGYPAYAPPPQNVHDGFFLRLHIGGGYAHMGGTDGFNDELAFVGGGGSFGLALGGTVLPNLVLFGNLFGMSLSDPDVEFNGTAMGSVSGSTTIGGIGPGAAYYFQPVNVYVSGTIAATFFQASDSDGTSQYESDTGIGFQGMVGKEWWVSQDWGLGIAAEFIAARGMADKADSSIKWAGNMFSLVFSATYN